MNSMGKRTLGTWSLVAVLMAILAAAVVFAYEGLTIHSDFTLPASSYIPLGLGVFFSLLVGVGLMALLFYSSSAGYDNPPTTESEHPDDQSQA
jgi:uncharacterized integral membrane protein